MADSCKEIVGDEANGAKTVIEFGEQDVENTEEEEFWNPPHKKNFLVISIPYRKGIHYAKRPRSFLPIIDQLQKLHKAGFVHGDIRAFNTVFGEKEDDPGYLIDFDFSDVPNSFYPEGYKGELRDGHRIGEGYSGPLPDDQQRDENEQMQTWHDWYALGRLIFDVHMLQIPEDVTDNELERNIFRRILRWLHIMRKLRLKNKFRDLKDFWLDIKRDPSPEEIKQLKKMLEDVDTANYKVVPSQSFKKDLDDLNDENSFKNVGATGSPLKTN